MEAPEACRYTSIYERIQALKSWWQNAAAADRCKLPTEHEELPIQSQLFVCPLHLAEHGDVAAAAQSHKPNPAPRLSDKGFLPLRLTNYVQLIDWTGAKRAATNGAVFPTG